MRALLSDFLDRTLHWRTSRTLEVHLAACPLCRVYVVSVEETILLHRKRPVVDVPIAVRGHLREVLRERHESAPKKRAGRGGLDTATKRTTVKPTAKKSI